MEFTKTRKVILGLLVVFGTVLALNWNEFVSGFREGVGIEDKKTSVNSDPGAGLQNPLSKQTDIQSPSSNQNLVLYQGQVFSVLKPSHWKASETRNGIDVYDPSYQGAIGAGGAVLIGAVGQTDPFQFADWFLNTTGLIIQKVIHQKTLSSEPGIMGTVWQRGIKEYIVLKEGQPFHLLFSVAICNGWGQYSALFSQAYSPESVWARWGQSLFEISESIKIINPSLVGGVQEMSASLPKNNPLDSSAVMSTWENKLKSDDRNSQNWQEAMMGYERGSSESTGRSYDMPLNNYDPTVGGYRNPDQPTEILNTDDAAQ